MTGATAAGNAKLDALLTHLEEGLRCEAFHIAQRDSASLLALLPQQGEVIRAVCILLASVRFEAAICNSVAERMEAAEATRRANVVALEELLGSMREELDELRQAGIRLRQLRREVPSSVSDQREPLELGWA